MISTDQLQKKHPELTGISDTPNRILADEYLLEVGAARLRRDLRLKAQQRRVAAYQRIQAPRKRIRKHMRPFPQ